MTDLKKNMDSSPLITIITVVFNAAKTLEKTIESIVNQSYSNIEYIIIDGASTDGSVDIAKKYQDKISVFVSEPDKGIYDAMNKGISHANGSWLLFINADDFLFRNTTIEEAVEFLKNTDSKVAYGNIIFMYPNSKEVLYGPSWSSIKYRFRKVAMCVAHQATFHSRMLFEDGQYDTSFRITADYEFLLRHLKDHDAFHFPVTIAKMGTEGLSFSVSKIALLKDIRRAQINNKIYKSIPSAAWIRSASKLLFVDWLIRNFGIDGKDKIKKVVGIKK